VLSGLCGKIFLGMASNFMKFHTSGASGLKNGQSDRKRNFEKANIEYRIMNVEVMYSVYFKKDLAKRFHPSKFDIQYSIFDTAELVAGCGSLF
jgi:hypothetical protein